MTVTFADILEDVDPKQGRRGRRWIITSRDVGDRHAVPATTTCHPGTWRDAGSLWALTSTELASSDDEPRIDCVDLTVEGRLLANGFATPTPRTFASVCASLGIDCPHHDETTACLHDANGHSNLAPWNTSAVGRRMAAARAVWERVGAGRTTPEARSRGRVAQLVHGVGDRGLPVDADLLSRFNASRFALRALSETNIDFSALRTAVPTEPVSLSTDQRSRCSVLPYYASTGRAQLVGSGALLGLDAALRGFVVPPPGRALIIADVVAEDLGVAIAYTRCAQARRDYADGDIYRTAAKFAGLSAPDDAQAAPITRRAVKTTINALLNGARPSTASKASRLPVFAVLAVRRVMLERWKGLVPALGSAVRDARETGAIRSARGWELKVTPSTSDSTISNFVMQSRGADLLGDVLLACAGTDMRIVGILHDAFILECSDTDLDATIEGFRWTFARCCRDLLGDDFELKLDLHILRSGERWLSPRQAPRFDLLRRAMEQVSR